MYRLSLPVELPLLSGRTDSGHLNSLLNKIIGIFVYGHRAKKNAAYRVAYADRG